jgi:hypothetical protein
MNSKSIAFLILHYGFAFFTLHLYFSRRSHGQSSNNRHFIIRHALACGVNGFDSIAKFAIPPGERGYIQPLAGPAV